MEKKRDSFFLPNDKTKEKARNLYKKNEAYDESSTVSSVQNDQQEKRPDKKPFDKKVYRLKKYSNKYKLDQWEEQRKIKLIRSYQKQLKKDSIAGTYKPMVFDEDNVDSTDFVGKYVRHPDLIDKENKIKVAERNISKDPFQKAKEKFNNIKQEKLLKQQEIERVREEKQKKLQEYRKKKQDRYKKLSKKTKKGQPVMTGRLELLLDKIQKEK